MNITHDDLVQAFADWENDLRLNPDTFMTPEEVTAAAVASVSELRALHLMALLRQRRAPETT